jgi:hypothetical protein
MYDFLVDKTVDITAREYHAAVYDGSWLRRKFNTYLPSLALPKRYRTFKKRLRLP